MLTKWHYQVKVRFNAPDLCFTALGDSDKNLAIARHFKLHYPSISTGDRLAYRELDGFGDGLEKRQGDAGEVLAGVVAGGDGELGEPPVPGLPPLAALHRGGLAEQLLVAPVQPLLLRRVPPLPRALRAAHRGAAPAPARPREGAGRGVEEAAARARAQRMGWREGEG